ncbi:MAG: transcription-repair coupling factor [Chloroflexota bacterium]
MSQPTQGLLSLWLEAQEFGAVAANLRSGMREQLVYGLSGSETTYYMAALQQLTNRPLLVLTPSLSQAERTAEDLRSWLGSDNVHVFPPLEVMPYEVIAASPELAAQRLAALVALTNSPRPIVVAPVGAALRQLVPPEEFWLPTFTLKYGQRVELEDVIARLAVMGYDRVDMVEGRGQFSIRGGILDVFPLGGVQPFRIEFFGDEVDSIRLFDIATQRSLENRDEILITPAREFLLPSRGPDEGMRRIRQELDTTVRRLTKQGHNTAAEKLRERVGEHLERLQEGQYFDALPQYAPLFYPELATIADYCPQDTIICLNEPVRLREAAAETEKQAGALFADLLQRGGALPGEGANYVDYAALAASVKKRSVVYFSLLLRRIPEGEPEYISSVPAKPMMTFHGQEEAFAQELNRWHLTGRRLVLVAASNEHANRLRSILADHELMLSPLTVDLLPGQAYVFTGSLENGFELPELNLAVVTEQEVFGKVKRRRRAAPRDEERGQRLTSYQDIKIGDFVVHAQHGIGRYLGVKTLEVENTKKDYLFVKYAGEDRLYVPTDQIGLIQKYVGAEGHEPKLNKLGGTEWARAKNKVKASVREMAEELLKLYAVRDSQPGHAFGPDTVWQREFEDSFRYEETPDQLKSIEEIKADMEKPKPMERLLCGDVGYGKTEVAIRAAFKAAMDGKQVAVLVPTTILAQQHFNTFTERFAGYPVKIGLLSRFRSPAEQQATIRGIATGTIEIAIGTHRLLSEDVRFKDLGLLIIDEEQRFGVAHKERLKRLKQNVDVLVLSATPIPRTLHMALVGLRDMSVIESPPEDRFPVQTYVVEANDDLVREAITREVNRGGQVYYVHNRVQDIDRVTERLQKLVPDIRIGVGHGQMSEEQLEKVMLDFLDGEIDVLVCTTIIESGLDIANVNTLIIDEADHYGLSQLYQLRGRVGRSNRLAYAYFTYKRDKVLTEVAEKRLQAIKEFTELGSGFKIAMRDLEIRGAGNILGPEQHGHILAVGFDLYCQLLEEAVHELKGEVPPAVQEPVIELAVDAFIPDSYITDPKQKIEVYKRIVASRDHADAADIEEELEDRFGELPAAVRNLLNIVRIKADCAGLGITSLMRTNGIVTFKFGPQRRLQSEHLMALQKANRNRLNYSPQRAAQLQMKAEDLDSAKLLRLIQEVLRKMHELVRQIAS